MAPCGNNDTRSEKIKLISTYLQKESDKIMVGGFKFVEHADDKILFTQMGPTEINDSTSKEVWKLFNEEILLKHNICERDHEGCTR